MFLFILGFYIAGALGIALASYCVADCLHEKIIWTKLVVGSILWIIVIPLFFLSRTFEKWWRSIG